MTTEEKIRIFSMAEVRGQLCIDIESDYSFVRPFSASFSKTEKGTLTVDCRIGGDNNAWLHLQPFPEGLELWVNADGDRDINGRGTIYLRQIIEWDKVTISNYSCPGMEEQTTDAIPTHIEQ